MRQSARACGPFLRPHRDHSFSTLTTEHCDQLRALLKAPRSHSIANDSAALEPFNKDWLNQVQGNASLVLLPTTTQEVSDVLRYCSSHRLAVVPQSGNTGLVYGSTPVHDEIVLSLSRMNQAPEVHPETQSITAEAGVILQTMQEAALEKDYLVPLDMASKGSCCIGGNLSTNAGGIHFARYGSMKANTLGLEAVLSDGRVLNLMSSLRKDNAGYDLKQLFIGSEGTLGVITKAELKLFPRPLSTQVLLLRVGSFEDLLRVHKLASLSLAECLSAFEVMDAQSLRLGANSGFPFPQTAESDNSSFCALIETHGANAAHDFEKLGLLLERINEANIPILDEALAQSAEQARKLWSVREELPVMLAKAGTIYKFDVSFPLHQFYDAVVVLRKQAADAGIPLDEVAIVGYGHFGDGNLHLNVIDKSRKHGKALERLMYPGVYEFSAKQRQGSISAEHGIGMQKKEYLSLSRSSESMEVMRVLKATMDPAGILNPYKVF